MRSLHLIALLLATNLVASAQATSGQPELKTVKTVTLSPSYSCRTAEEFRGGYAGTALFLSEASRSHNSPDLVFNGACGSKDYFTSATHGGNTSLVADLGTGMTLEAAAEIDDFNSFQFPKRAYKPTGFLESALVEPGHTYAVSLNKHDIRGLFVFTVTGYEPNRSVELRYVVREYQVGGAAAAKSPGSESVKAHSQQ